MRLILIRHGDAGAYTLPDNERNLSALGKAQATQTADWLFNTAHLQTPVQFITSPYNRACQTLDVISDKLASKLPTPLDISVHNGITPDDNAALAILELSKAIKDDIVTDDGTLVVVCHMSIIANIASLLTGENEANFALAEARVYEMGFLDANLAKHVGGFVPQIDSDKY